MCAGIVVTNTVLRIEPIGFQEKMKIENGYKTAIPDFEFFKSFETYGKIVIKNCLFPKFSEKFFVFSKTGIYVREHLSMNRFTTFQVDVLKKTAEFCRFECRKGHFLLHLQGHRQFPDLKKKCPILKFKNCSRVVFCVLDENLT